MSKKFTDHQFHDQKAALAEFFMVMSSIEATIEDLFKITLEIKDFSASAILKNISTVSRRLDIIVSVSEKRKDTAAFQALIKEIRSRLTPLREARNSYAHSISQDEQRNCLSYTKDGEMKSLTGPTIEMHLADARQLSRDLALFTLHEEGLKLFVEVIKDVSKNKANGKVILEAYEARNSK